MPCFVPMIFRRLERFLFAPTLPLWRYSIVAYLLASLPSLLLTAIAIAVFTLAGMDISTLRAPAHSLTIPAMMMTAIFAPIVETFALAYLLTLLSSTTLRTGTIAAISGVAWGIFHGLFGLLWFFGTAWAFFVLSCAYLAWRKVSFRHAFLATAVPHAMNNAIMLTVMTVLHA